MFTTIDRNILNLRIDSLNEDETVVLATFHDRTYRIVRRITGGNESPFGPEPTSVRYFVELPNGRGVACRDVDDVPRAIVQCHIFAEWRDAQ